MDGKKVAIGVLVVLAVLLGCLVANGLHGERAAYARASVYDTYLATSIEVRDNFVNFAILDTDTRRLLFYDISLPKYELQPTTGVMLTRDFPGRAAP